MQGWVSSLSCQFSVFLLCGKTCTDPQGGGGGQGVRYGFCNGETVRPCPGKTVLDPLRKYSGSVHGGFGYQAQFKN